MENTLLGNDKQKTKMAEIIAACPANCSITETGLLRGCNNSVYVDLTTPLGVAFRVSIAIDGLVSKNRIMKMDAAS